MLHTGRLQLQWTNVFEVCFVCGELPGSVRIATFLEAEKTVLFLASPEFGLAPQEAAEALRQSCRGSPVTLPACIQLTDEQLRELFPWKRPVIRDIAQPA